MVLLVNYRFVKEVGIIGSAQIMTALGGFLLLPIITKTLGAYDYGLWAQISITIAILVPFARLGLPMAVVRFLASESNKENIREGFFSVLFVVTLAGLCISLLLFLFSDCLAFAVFKDIKSSYLIKLGSILVLFSAVSHIVIYYFRIFQQIRTFAIFTLFQQFGHLILTIIFLLIGFGVSGIISSLVITTVMQLFIALYIISSQIGFSIPKFTEISSYLKYGIPLIPNSLVRWITDSSDRYILSYFLGLNYVGIYSASYAIGNLIQLMIVPIQFILFPELCRLFDENKIEDVKIYLGYSMRYFILLAIPAAFGLSALAKPILTFFTTPEFASGSIVIPFVALSGILAGVFQIIINITHLVKKTQFNFYILMSAAFSNIILNIVLIPSIGMMGAAIATSVSYFTMVCLCIHVSFKYIKFNLDFMYYIKSIVSSIIMAAVILLLPPTSTSALFTDIVLGIFVYLIMMILLKAFNKNELNFVKGLYHFIKKSVCS